MSLRAPAIEWPTSFDAQGPAEDPNILLSAQACIAGVTYAITAIRMREGMRMPDYRDDVPSGAYEDALDSMREEIEVLASTMDPPLVSLGDGNYLLWMVPSAPDQNEPGSDPA